MNKLDMSKELKPCPFCGGAGQEDSAGVHCDNTDCGAHFLTFTWNQWNTRAQLDSGEWVSVKERLPDGWRLIDTAPKDGTRILLAKIVGHPDHGTALWWASMGFWSDKWNNWNDGIEPSGYAGPTHWIPISAHGVGNLTSPVQAASKPNGWRLVPEYPPESMLIAAGLGYPLGKIQAVEKYQAMLSAAPQPPEEK